jgi:hypothetical protein
MTPASTPVKVHPGALSSGVAVAAAAAANTCPLYVTSLRHRLAHFLAEPRCELWLNGGLAAPAHGRYRHAGTALCVPLAIPHTKHTGRRDNDFSAHAQVARGGADALFAAMDERIAPCPDALGLFGAPGAAINPADVRVEPEDCLGFRGRLRMARSSQAEGHARWGTALFGDHFGTTESGGLVVYVNGALVRRQKNDWQ